jgi:hypothetical protein
VITCSLHTRTIAGWSCTECHRALCPECAGWRSTGIHRVTLCMRCGGPATRLRTQRSIRAPFRYSLLGALGWPASSGGLATLLCCAALIFGLGLIGRYGRLAGYGLVLCWFLQLVRKSASGGDEVPGPSEFTGVIEGIVSPGLRAALASVWVLGPFAIWFVFAGYRLGALAQHPVHLDAAAIGLGCAGLLLAPLAMVVAALDSPLQLIVNPFAMIALTFELGVDYGLATLSCALCAGGTVLLQIATRTLFRNHPFPLDGLVALLCLLYLPMVAFRALGLLVRARGDTLGYGSAEFYRVPILDAVPVHEVKPPEQKLIEIEPRFAEALEPGSSVPGIVLNLPDPTAEIRAPIPLLPLEDESSEWFVSQPSPIDNPKVPAAPAPAAVIPTGRARITPGAGWTTPITPAAPAPAGRTSAPGARKTPGAPGSAVPKPHLPSLLAQKMAARDLPAAREAMRVGPEQIPATTLSAASWNELVKAFADDAAKAQGPERTALAELALIACKRGLEVAPEGPIAPRMWLTAARLCDELLRDRARSNEMLSELSKRFPGSAEGVFAKKRLGAPPKLQISQPPAAETAPTDESIG